MARRILLLVLLLLVGGAGWFVLALPPRVAIVQAQEGPALEAVYATGAVEPVNLARVGPAVRARVTEVLVEEGERVVEGQPMARLDDRQSRALAAEAEARARFAAEDLARTRALVTRDIAARATLERAERDASTARAAAEAANQRLDEYIVRAPSDGVVLKRDVEVGEVVDTPASLFWVGEPRPLRITAEVDEEDIARIAIGQRVLLRADAFQGRVLTAEVAQITPKGDTTRKAYRVRLALPDDTPLMIGMTVEANIVLRDIPNAVLLPPGAVQFPPALRGAAARAAPETPATGPRRATVWVVEKEIAHARTVEVGVQAPRMTEIRGGLAPGEAVVMNPPPGLADGQPIRLHGIGSGIAGALAAMRGN